jgi:hypothetical protein
MDCWARVNSFSLSVVCIFSLEWGANMGFLGGSLAVRVEEDRKEGVFLLETRK